MTGRLEGKVAIVTGAAPSGDGIGNGAAAAILYAREGAKVVLVNRSEERAAALREKITSEGGNAMVCPADVTVEDDVARVMNEARAEYGKLDILHNNVGIAGAGPLAFHGRAPLARRFVPSGSGQPPLLRASTD